MCGTPHRTKLINMIDFFAAGGPLPQRPPPTPAPPFFLLKKILKILFNDFLSYLSVLSDVSIPHTEGKRPPKNGNTRIHFLSFLSEAPPTVPMLNGAGISH
jgi:hypothetical protein